MPSLCLSKTDDKINVVLDEIHRSSPIMHSSLELSTGRISLPVVSVHKVSRIENEAQCIQNYLVLCVNPTV